MSQLSGTGGRPATRLEAVGVEVLVRRSCPSYGAGVGTPVYPSPFACRFLSRSPHRGVNAEGYKPLAALPIWFLGALAYLG